MENNNLIKIYDYEDYEGTKFEENYRDYWFENCSEYGEDGTYNGDPYDHANVVLSDYMKNWCIGHGVADDSDEAKKESETVKRNILEHHKVKNITPEEAEKRWQEYADSENICEDAGREATMDWEDEIANLKYDKFHFLRTGTFIVTGSAGRWNGTRSGTRIWRPKKSCDNIGELIQQFCYEALNHCDYIQIYADLSDGAINFTGIHHDGSDSYSLYAIDEFKLIDKDECYVDLEEYMEANDMSEDDCIGSLTASLADVVKNIYSGNTEIADVFKPYKK